MSNGPTLMGSNAVESTKENWCNIEILKHMYCSYSGDCPLQRVIQGKEICIWCEYRAGINMPVIINEILKRED